MTVPEEGTTTAALSWSAANQEYLQAELVRLRLRLQRRALWMRKVWKRDLAPDLQSLQGLVITDDEADFLLQADLATAESRFYEHDEVAVSISRKIQGDIQISDAAQSAFAAEGPPALEIISRM